MRLLIFFFLLINIPAFAQLNADFSASITQACTGTNIQFTDNSTGSPTSWFWDFGDGQTSTLQNPLITYTVSGKYTVRLTIQNGANKNYEEKTNYITINTTPLANFLITGNNSGCYPVSTSFQDASQPLGATINSWLWDFGDGATSTQKNPSHTYTAQGRYTVSLTVQTTQGCSSTFKVPGTVAAGSKPAVNFSASPLNGCAHFERNFKNKTPGNISSVEWDFGDGNKSTETDPQYHYQDTGYFNVKLKVSNNGCMDSLEIPNYIHVDGPAAWLYRQTINCSDPFTFTYHNYSVADTGFYWDFGDGATSTDKVATHTYSNPGVYIVKLFVTGTTCNDTAYDTLRIKLGNPKINISPVKNVHCLNDSVLFYVTGYDSASTKSFWWNFGDGVTTFPNAKYDSIYYVYKSNGNFTPTVYIRNTYFCLDSFTSASTVSINSPKADFQSTATGCTNTSITFKDKSADGANAQIKEWLWSYGDGSVDNGSGPVKYAYEFPGTYNVQLIVTDENECADTITHQVVINNTPIVDAGIDTFACAGANVSLDASGANNYVWQSNPDLSCTNCSNPIATPQQSTTYFVTGTAAGCSATDSVHIEVQQKELVKVDVSQYAICSGGNSVMLIASGTDKYSWSPSNTLSSTIVPNPVAFPSTNTTYTVTGSDSRNCFTDNATVDVIVNEKPSVTITDSIVQVMTGFNYTIPGVVSSDVQSFEWIPMTGLSCTNCLQPTVTVNGNSEYKLVGTNQFGCTDTANITIIAICSGDALFVPNTFSPNNDGMNDYFYPRSSNTITIKSLSIFNRWGQMVFQKQNFSSNNPVYGWDGTYNGKPQQADVYVYVMELQCSDNRAAIKKGDLSLIR